MSVLYNVQSMLNRKSEIGREFWIESEPQTLHTEKDGVYCLSGRTAIDLIIQDILRNRVVKSVAMPAWCCDSMISPFLERGITVSFYDVCYERGRLRLLLDTVGTVDVFYLTNYFGYKNTLQVETVKQIKRKGSVILYDRTHAFLMDDMNYRTVADYSFSSIRKWMGVVCGAVLDGLYDIPALRGCNYINSKKLAMREKYRYLTGDTSIVKDDYLAAFGEFSHHLSYDYRNYEMDKLSYTLYKQEDMLAMGRRRKENASFIHENLKEVQFVSEITDNDTPLFVPVLFESKEQRDIVRRKLIEQQIYCPIHWPQPNQIPTEYKVNDIVSRELSLICDQRYGLSEMKREINTIKQYI